MILDFNTPEAVVGAVIVFPDFPTVNKPAQANDIRETIIIQGSTGGASISITGTADQQE